ncbi:coordinator of PRMT5 and differentiation stimulator isoform X2 [Hemicordylus capensis]|uniref:coordinator of PRMT5 and differentiation stimulator isoform X2 n=1 Tax=Hemicordylus capensis TaxID=884348 RepID=UPI002302AC34|nr:coordinator of PRMT5 and differentiation stimulator isoform X2 [Hemicordylus capensis]
MPLTETGVDGSALTGQNEVEVVKRVKTFCWRPRKGCTKEDEILFSAAPQNKTGGNGLTGPAEVVTDDMTSSLDESDDLDSDVEDCSMPTDTVFPELKTASHYEKEDWDKELADSKYSDNPYDFEDVIHCGSFQDQDPMASCSLQEEPLYDPSLHHVAPLTVSQLQAVLVDGQFDDAVD